VSKAKLYIDEDAAEKSILVELRKNGIDILTVLEAERVGETDEEQLRFATSCKRVLYSLNVGDFAQLHQLLLSQGEKHSGIIVIPRQRYSIGEKLRQLTKLLDDMEAEDFENNLYFL